MNSEKWVDLTCRCFCLQSILGVLPPDFPSVRELRIQNAKLQRMVMAKEEYTGLRHILGGGSVKKAKKLEGKRAAQVGEQARKVRILSDKSFKEFLRQNRSITNKEFQDWKAKFESAMDGQVAKIKKQVRNASFSICLRGRAWLRKWVLSRPAIRFSRQVS